MLGSIFIGLSGMQAYSEGLRQVSNNITNLNSTGFKGSSVLFNDLFNAVGSQVSGDTSGTGGGVELSKGRLDLGQGELRQSERDLDLAVEGDGFLVLSDGDEQVYARTGSFEVAEAGYIALAETGYRLNVIDEAGELATVSIESDRIHPPQQTTMITFAENLSSTATSYTISDLEIFDALGAADAWSLAFNREETDPAGEWTLTVTTGDGRTLDSQTLRFGTGGLVDTETEKLVFSDEETGRSVTFDFSEDVTGFSSGEISTLRTADIDGYGVGEITRITVTDAGHLEIGYSNEQTKDLGAIALAEFQDPQALKQKNGGLFTYDGQVGPAVRTSQHESVGQVLSQRVEASNVDLSAQFGDLILVQRGYQASSQVVSVSNDMIQQLFGIRGQG